MKAIQRPAYLLAQWEDQKETQTWVEYYYVASPYRIDGEEPRDIEFQSKKAALEYMRKHNLTGYLYKDKMRLKDFKKIRNK